MEEDAQDAQKRLEKQRVAAEEAERKRYSLAVQRDMPRPLQVISLPLSLSRARSLSLTCRARCR